MERLHDTPCHDEPSAGNMLDKEAVSVRMSPRMVHYAHLLTNSARRSTTSRLLVRTRSPLAVRSIRAPSCFIPHVAIQNKHLAGTLPACKHQLEIDSLHFSPRSWRPVRRCCCSLLLTAVTPSAVRFGTRRLPAARWRRTGGRPGSPPDPSWHPKCVCRQGGSQLQCTVIVLTEWSTALCAFW